MLQDIPWLIGREENLSPEKEIVEIEVVEAIWIWNPDKTPSLNSFIVHLFRVC